MKTLEIYDNNACGDCIECDTCEVESDMSVQVNHIKKLLIGKDIIIEKYNLDNVKLNNKTVKEMISIKGEDILPITIMNGMIIKVGSYPTNKEFSLWLNLEMDDLLTLASSCENGCCM